MSNYIDNNKFEALALEYISGDLSRQDELFNLIHLLINRIMMGYNFKIEKEDAVQECFLLIIKVLKNFHPSKGKFFNYCTTVILNNLRLLFTKTKKYNSKKEEYISWKLGTIPNLKDYDL